MKRKNKAGVSNSFRVPFIRHPAGMIKRPEEELEQLEHHERLAPAWPLATATKGRS